MAPFWRGCARLRRAPAPAPTVALSPPPAASPPAPHSAQISPRARSVPAPDPYPRQIRTTRAAGSTRIGWRTAHDSSSSHLLHALGLGELGGADLVELVLGKHAHTHALASEPETQTRAQGGGKAGGKPRRNRRNKQQAKTTKHAAKR
eukprot:1933149-Rhodomonas_salina.2